MGISNSIKFALNELNVPIPDDLNWCIGPPLHESFSELLKNYPDKCSLEGVRLFRVNFEQTGLFENRVYDGIEELLNSLQKYKCHLFVATSKPRIYAEKILAHFSLDKFFRVIYGSELNGVRSNKTKLITHIIKQESLPTDSVLMIGDRKFDMIGARENGIFSAGVTWGYGTLNEIESEKPNHIFDSPKALNFFLTTNFLS